MDKELLQIALMTQGGFLFAFGGWRQKFWRRFVMPLLGGVLLYFLTGLLLQSILSAGILMIVMHLGYGESTPWYLKALVAMSYALPALVFGWTYWLLVMPINFFTMFVLSNLKATEKDFFWKAVEFLTGAMIYITIIAAIGRLW